MAARRSPVTATEQLHAMLESLDPRHSALLRALNDGLRTISLAEVETLLARAAEEEADGSFMLDD